MRRTSSASSPAQGPRGAKRWRAAADTTGSIAEHSYHSTPGETPFRLGPSANPHWFGLRTAQSTGSAPGGLEPATKLSTCRNVGVCGWRGTKSIFTTLALTRDGPTCNDPLTAPMQYARQSSSFQPRRVTSLVLMRSWAPLSDSSSTDIVHAFVSGARWIKAGDTGRGSSNATNRSPDTGSLTSPPLLSLHRSEAACTAACTVTGGSGRSASSSRAMTNEAATLGAAALLLRPASWASRLSQLCRNSSARALLQVLKALRNCSSSSCRCLTHASSKMRLQLGCNLPQHNCKSLVCPTPSLVSSASRTCHKAFSK
mmetsp:Transcript_62098/g.178132  ORF Transcript_62098/g.178132 Transcript_62098/m.178132 type:complete len:314 (+) Transcript_62098:328-1269(+)